MTTLFTQEYLNARDAKLRADADAYFKVRAELNTYGGRTAFDAGYQRGFDAASKVSDTEATIEDFAEGQWWLKELDAMVANGTHDQKRAVAVVRNLLGTAKKQQPQAEAYGYVDETGEPVRYEDKAHRAEMKNAVHFGGLRELFLSSPQQAEVATTPKPEGPRNAVLKDSDLTKPGEVC